MKLLCIFFLFIFSFQISAEEYFPEALTCKDAMSLSQDILKRIKTRIQVGRDLDERINQFNELLTKYPDCVSYKKLKVNDNDLAKIRKFMYAPDRSFNLSEENCSEYTVDTSHMPKNMNQGPLSWCFAFSSADLLSFYEKKRFAAYDMALTNHLSREDINKNRKYDYGDMPGWPYETIIHSASSGKGICLEDDFNFQGMEWEKVSEMFKNLTIPDKKLSQILCENKFQEKEIFLNLTPQIVAILDKLSSEKSAAALLDTHCKRVEVEKKYSVVTMSTIHRNKKYSAEELFAQMDKVLSKGEPVSIMYPSNLLKYGENFKGEMNHVSTVVGRKFNKASGLCEYQIKNSWGDEKKCQQTSSIKCEKGMYWVPRTALKNNLTDITWMEKGSN